MDAYLVAVQVTQAERSYTKTVLAFSDSPENARRTVEQVADSAEDLVGTTRILGVVPVDEEGEE